MAVSTGPVSRPRGPTESLRLPVWVAITLAVAVVLMAAGSGGLALASILGRPIQVQAPGQPAAVVPNTVTVQGVGRVAAAPDTMWVQVGVDLQRGTVRDALTAAAAGANKVTTAIKGAGVAATDVQTSSFGVYPVTNMAGQVTGYDASSMLSVRIADIGKANAILSAAADAGGNDVRFGSIQYGLTNDAAQVTQARQAAVTAAAGRAADLSKASGRTLGTISSMDEQYVGYVPAGNTIAPGAGIGGGGGATVPTIQVGQGTLIVQVAVTYQLS